MIVTNNTEIAASIGIHQLKKAWDFQRRCEDMAAIYDEALQDLPVMIPLHAKKAGSHQVRSRFNFRA